MNGRCPEDGGFIGEVGCTHPNHRHSELVEKIVAGTPRLVSTREAEAALKEGFYVKTPEGNLAGFGPRLLAHIEDDHLKGDADGRKTRLMFAVETVRRPDRVEKNHRGIAGRTMYAKKFNGFGILAITEKGGDAIEYAFTIIPRRKGGK